VLRAKAAAVTVRKREPATAWPVVERKTQACCRTYETRTLATKPALEAATGRTCRPSARARPMPKWVRALAPPLTA
jgi:hypothetical protein